MLLGNGNTRSVRHLDRSLHRHLAALGPWHLPALPVWHLSRDLSALFSRHVLTFLYCFPHRHLAAALLGHRLAVLLIVLGGLNK